jgi:hypothetical protein
MQSTEKFKNMTNKQGVQLAYEARKRNVSREKMENFLGNKEKLDEFFRNFVNDDDWFQKLEVSAKTIGARVYLIPKLVVDYTKPHNEYAMAGGPQIPSNYNVLKVADKYQPSENKATEETIVLFNWKKGGGSYLKAIEWGLSNSLSSTTPHVPFAVGEQKPNLNYELGPNPMYVVETTGCTFDSNAHACCVWWGDARREPSLYRQDFFGNDIDWFAFRKKWHFGACSLCPLFTKKFFFMLKL